MPYDHDFTHEEIAYGAFCIYEEERRWGLHSGEDAHWFMAIERLRYLRATAAVRIGLESMSGVGIGTSPERPFPESFSGSRHMSFPYQFHYGDPGLFAEIYLPKKAVYQGMLYDTLTNGFKVNIVKEHLRYRKEAVQNFLGLHDYDLYDSQVEQLTQILQGYSMYEVDGFFWEPGTPVAEERNQVIRLLFYAPPIGDSEAQKSTARSVGRQYLRFWTHSLDDFNAEVARPRGGEFGHKVRSQLSDWLAKINLYINGYIVFKICEGIVRLKELGDIPKLEDQIWVTSLRGLAVNRVRRPGSP
jgi:hypothetical protein